MNPLSRIDTDDPYPESDGQPMADNTEQYEWIVKIKENLEVLRAEQEAAQARAERERARQASMRAEREHQRAAQEATQARAERERAERLAQRLRSLGIDPDSL